MLALTVKAKTHWFFHLRFKLSLQLINDISKDLQKLFRYSNTTALPINLVLYLKDLKLSSSAAIALSKLVATSLE